jgi:hypothetical protein
MISLRTKCFLSPALLFGLSMFGLAGCGEQAENKTKVEQSTPTGTTTEEKSDKIKQTGSNPPAPTGTSDVAPPK